MKKLQLFILPSFESVRDSMGFDESDDYDADAVLFQQGYNGNLIDIADNEIFDIEEGFIGRINSKKDYYLITDKEDLENKDEFLIEDDLPDGKYNFSAKDRVIYRLESDDDYDENYESEDNDPRIERIFNLITDSAKNRFDYDSFSDKIGDESADSLLFQIMVSLAIGESKELTVAKLNAQIMMMGLMMEKDSFVHFLEAREKDLGMHILALKIAQTNLEDGADPEDVYLQTEDFISKLRK